MEFPGKINFMTQNIKLDKDFANQFAWAKIFGIFAIIIIEWQIIYLTKVC